MHTPSYKSRNVVVGEPDHEVVLHLPVDKTVLRLWDLIPVWQQATTNPVVILGVVNSGTRVKRFPREK